MIVQPSMFKGEIYIPHAKASITDAVTDVASKLMDFIDNYEQEALEKCLGRLSTEFFSMLDAEEPSFIKAGSDAKWDHLMNGHEYTKSGNEQYIWRGIRRGKRSLGVSASTATPPLPIVYDYSFLAEYIYFFYEKNDFITRTDAGNAKVKPANAYVEKPSFKVINAWRRFVEAVQGEDSMRATYGHKTGFLGGTYIDYRGFEKNQDVSLYQFITDMNGIDSETYKDFNPKRWGTINQFTI